VKAADHSIGVEDVGHRHEHHALVMRQMVSHDHADGVRGGPIGRRRGIPVGVVDRVKEAVLVPQAGLAQPRRFATLASGVIIAASALAYGATTSSSASPRFKPMPGTPKALYWKLP